MGDLSKAVPDDGGQRVVVEMVVIDLSSKVGLSPSPEPVVQATGTGSSSRNRSGASSGSSHWRVS